MFRSRSLSTVLVAFVLFLLGVFTVSAQDETEYVDPCVVSEDAAAAEATVAPPDNSDISFIILLPNPRGDRSFIDSAAAGAERAIAQLGVTGTIVETAGTEEHDAAIRRAIQESPDLIISIAFDPTLVLEIAEEFPDQRFAAQESFVPEDHGLDNLALFTIFTHENSYLAGIAAGMLSETKIVGAVGGGDFPGINQFIVGFEEGVLSVCPDCQTLRSYTGSFTDPVLGKEQALSLYAQGADILYQVAGRSGEGVLQAAEETGNLAIGVDSNQDDLYPGSILVSAMKRVDNAVFSFVESIVNDTYAPGTTTVGMAEGFAGLSWDVGVCSRTIDATGDEALVAMLPEVRMAIEEARAAILAGDIVVTNALLEGAE